MLSSLYQALAKLLAIEDGPADSDDHPPGKPTFLARIHFLPFIPRDPQNQIQ